MKRVFFLTLILGLGLTLAACKDETTTTSTTPTQTTTQATTVSTTTILAAPENLALNGRTLTWSPVTGATNYTVKINDTETTITNATYQIPETFFGTLTISVKAGAVTTDSPYSTAIVRLITKTLPYPANLAQAGSTVSWSPVADASGYVIKINGVEYFTMETTYAINPATATTIQVLAVGNETAGVLTSAYSPALTIKVPLAAVTNIRYEAGVLMWNPVTHATGYILTIGTNPPVTLSTNVYDNTSAHAGALSVTVTAIDASGTYLDSSPATTTITFPTQTLAIVTNLAINGGVLTFDSVALADGYHIYHNGEYLAQVTTNLYAIPAPILAEATGFLQVMAVSQAQLSSPLSERIYLAVQVITSYPELLAMTTHGSYELGNDIVATGSWTPKDFSGNFDGKGFSISGLAIDTPHDHTGFFGLVADATISNLRLAGTLNVTSDIYQIAVGGLAGSVLNSAITDVQVEMDIILTSTNGIARLGGLVGILENTDVTGAIYSGTITSTNAIAGGLIGIARNPEQTSQISQSGTNGTITATGGEQSPAGGFIGMFINNSLTVSEA